jgi:ABC-2 type transport system permease protein
MTTTTIHAGKPLSRLSFGGVLNSEWIKLRSLRSTLWCYLILFVLTVGIGLLVAANQNSGAPMSTDQQNNLAVLTSTVGVNLGQLVIAVLGALVITGEYGTGMIRSTLTAVPKRLPALYAKAIIFGVSTFIVAIVSMGVTALVTAPLLSNAGIHADLGDSRVFLPILGGAVYLALLGILSLALGTIIRSSAGGIAASLGFILVVPGILQLVGRLINATWPLNIAVYLPSATGGQLYAYVSQHTPPAPAGGPVVLDTWQAALVFVGWVVVLLAAASVLLKRRDA